MPKILSRIAIVLLAGLILFVLLLPFGRGPGAREAARRMQCSNHLKQIGIALHNYHDIYGCFPPAYTTDSSGKPLHSWRTLILPYCEQKALYNQIDLSKPWDDPANKQIAATIVPTYHCPSSSVPKSHTAYLAPCIAGACFQPTNSTPMSAITDGSSNTLMVLEVPDEHAVHWMSPDDLDEALLTKLAGKAKPPHPSGAMAAFADGHTQMLPRDLKPAILRALVSIAGNDNELARQID